MLVPVTWTPKLAALVLAVLWLPATSHSLLEQAGWIHTEHAEEGDSSGTDSDHDAADGTCRAASTDVPVPQPALTNSPAPFSSLDFSLVLATLPKTSLAAPNGPDPPGAAPPELSRTWQFCFRASLSPRAPSLIS